MMVWDYEARLRFYEQSRRKYEAVYREDPLDAANLSILGKVLLELTEYEEYSNDRTLVQDAISKLEGALAISPPTHVWFPETVWFLGGAYTKAAFLTTDDEAANIYFQKASECFQNAVDMDPKNFNYTESLEMCPNAPFERAAYLGRTISDCASVGGHVKVPEQQTEIQSDMGSNKHISIGHVKVPEQQAEIQSDMGSNQHISIGHVKVMLENLAVSDMI